MVSSAGVWTHNLSQESSALTTRSPNYWFTYLFISCLYSGGARRRFWLVSSWTRNRSPTTCVWGARCWTTTCPGVTTACSPDSEKLRKVSMYKILSKYCQCHKDKKYEIILFYIQWTHEFLVLYKWPEDCVYINYLTFWNCANVIPLRPEVIKKLLSIWSCCS